MSLNQTNEYLDLVLLEQYLNSIGKAVVEQMFGLYCQQVNTYLADIEKASADKCIIEWRQHCHKMKGAAGSVGMKVLSEGLKKLEALDVLRLDDAANLVINLRKQNKQSIAVFKIWLEGLTQ
jgi:HPt (histidine-containing phosphotransfer) domain-containing protein